MKSKSTDLSAAILLVRALFAAQCPVGLVEWDVIRAAIDEVAGVYVIACRVGCGFAETREYEVRVRIEDGAIVHQRRVYM
jgi:hypothetical protein